MTASTLSPYCGHHCGTQDGRTAHCWCSDCHDGEPGYSCVQTDGCAEWFTLDGQPAGGESSAWHEPGSHVDLSPMPPAA